MGASATLVATMDSWSFFAASAAIFAAQAPVLPGFSAAAATTFSCSKELSTFELAKISARKRFSPSSALGSLADVLDVVSYFHPS
jgi:hypothetical protein